MEQTIINAVFACLGAVLSFILKVIWDGLRDLQKADIELATQVSSVKLMMADSYIKKEDFERLSNAIFNKLDRIEGKLDSKQDKHCAHSQ